MNRRTAGVHHANGVPAAAGTIAHHVCATLLTARGAGTPDIDTIENHVRTACKSLDRRLNSTRVRVLAFTAAAKYLTLLQPTDATFIGAEVPFGAGRADLVWASDAGVFVDELKTERFLAAEEAAEQAARYVTAGVDTFRERFLGCRIVATSQQRRSMLVTPELHVVSLADTPLAFDALRAQTTLSRAV